MSYSDYGDYGDDPRRPSRRATREPARPDKVQGSTAAAILVFVAIVGFGIGALIGSAGGDDTPTTTTENPEGAAAGSPNEQGTSPDGSETDEPTDGSTEGEGSDDEASGGNGITLMSPQDDGEVPEGESGTIDVQAELQSGEEGVTLQVERSLDGGQTWEGFCDQCADETSGSGTYTTNFWTGQTGENLFRVVGPDGLTSNPINVTVVGGDGDDSDDSD